MTLELTGGSAAIRGAAQRAAVLPLLLDPPADASAGNPGRLAWNNNWADWDNSGSHNEWEDWNPTPPGG